MFSKIVLGLTIGQVSSVQVRAADFVPFGIRNGLDAMRLENQPVTVALFAPESSTEQIVGELESAIKAHQLSAKAHESETIAAKQRILNDEISRIRGSFLKTRFGDMAPSNDFEVTLHVPEENDATLKSSISALQSVENAKAASANGEFANQKRQLRDVEAATIRRIVASAFA